MTKIVQIQWTASSLVEAQKVANQLVINRLVACANFFPVESIYLWEGKLQTSNEIKVLLKTRHDLFQKVRDFILQNATYEVPEISLIEFQDGNPLYMDWVMSSTKELE